MWTLIRRTGLTVGIVLLLIVVGFGVSAAASADVLIAAALPFALVLILAIRAMGRPPELIAWAAFTVWLGSTYLSTGSPLEMVLLCAYMVMAALGLFKSPYFLAAAWLFHPIWDFLPRELPMIMINLPTACILFDIPIGLYLLWGARHNRWTLFGAGSAAPGEGEQALVNAAKTLAVAFILLGVTFLVVALADAGLLLWSALPVGAVLIGLLRLLGRTSEMVAWAVFTGWMGMAFAHTGGLLEAVVFFGSVALAGLGVFRSTAFMSLAWVLFIPWSIVPHPLPDGYADLPLAAALFAVPIALYLAWGTRARRWSPIEDEPVGVSRLGEQPPP